MMRIVDGYPRILIFAVILCQVGFASAGHASANTCLKFMKTFGKDHGDFTVRYNQERQMVWIVDRKERTSVPSDVQADWELMMRECRRPSTNSYFANELNGHPKSVCFINGAHFANDKPCIELSKEAAAKMKFFDPADAIVGTK